MEETRILINCLLLSQCSGGYRSYFKNVVVPLVSRLNENNIVTKVLLPQLVKREYGGFFDSQHILVDPKNKKGYLRIFHEHKLIPMLAREHGFTKIYTPYQIGPVKIPGVECILMFRNMEPYVAANYDYPLKNKIRSFLLRRFSKNYLNRADQVIAVSEFTKKFLIDQEKIKNRKITVIPHGIEPPKAMKSHKEEDFILTVGSMSPYKRLEDLIVAFDLFKKQTRINTKLVIVGSGMDSRYQKKINDLVNNSQYKNEIYLKGKLSHEDVVDLFLKCKIFIMTSEVEACPNTALEAMSLGCAIISSENQPMPEFFGDAVKYYPYRDSQNLAKQIGVFLSNPDVMKDYRQKAIKRSELYIWEKTIFETEKLLIN